MSSQPSSFKGYSSGKEDAKWGSILTRVSNISVQKLTDSDFTLTHLCVWDPFYTNQGLHSLSSSSVCFVFKYRCVHCVTQMALFLEVSCPQRCILHPANMHSPTGFSSLHQLLILQYLITCEMLNLSIHMLQVIDLQGTQVTLDSDSSDCSLPMLIAMFSMTLGLVWFCLVSTSSLLKFQLYE